MRRIRPEVWILIGLAFLGAIVGFDALMRLRAETTVESTRNEPETENVKLAETAPPEPEPLRAEEIPAVPLASRAPEFTLPDESGKMRRLSDFRGKRTVLAFYCNCARCSMMASALQKIEEQVTGEPPVNLVVTTINVEAIPRWREDTGFQGTILLEKHGGPVMKRYEGHPCPRVYVLNPDLTVRHITPAPKVSLPPDQILNPLSRAVESIWMMTPSGAPS